MSTRERLSFDIAPEAYEAKRALELYIARCGLPHDLCELIKLRVSMINGCAFCVDMHWTKLRAMGACESKLYGLAAWREQEGYSGRERAALAWAESLARVAETHVPDEEFVRVAEHFSPKEIADLSYVVAAITGWNQICVGFRRPPASTLVHGRS